MANRRRHPRRTDQFASHETDELSRVSVQHFHERPSRLHICHTSAHRADLPLFPALHRAAQPRVDLLLCLHLDVNGGIDAILHHLQPGHDGLLDPRNLDHRFHRLFLRIFPGWADVSDRHHAKRGAGRDEMAPLLLRVILPDRHFSWTITRRGARTGTGDSNRLALAHLGGRARYVETRPRPLSGGRWIAISLSVTRRLSKL